DAPTVTLDQCAAEIEAQSQAHACPALASGVRCAVEALEEVRPRLGRDTRSEVADADQRLSCLATQHDKDGRVVGRVLESVGEQVGEHLLETSGLRLDEKRRAR